MPKLIGMFTLSFGLQRHGSADEPRELIQRVATDSDGQQWGLVERLTPLPELGSACRVTFDRWIRFDAIPFAPDEVIGGDGQWVSVPARKV